MRLVPHTIIVLDMDEMYFKCPCGNTSDAQGFEYTDSLGNPEGYEYVIAEEMKGCKWYKCLDCSQRFYEPG